MWTEHVIELNTCDERVNARKRWKSKSISSCIMTIKFKALSCNCLRGICTRGIIWEIPSWNSNAVAANRLDQVFSLTFECYFDRWYLKYRSNAKYSKIACETYNTRLHNSSRLYSLHFDTQNDKKKESSVPSLIGSPMIAKLSDPDVYSAEENDAEWTFGPFYPYWWILRGKYIWQSSTLIF